MTLQAIGLYAGIGGRDIIRGVSLEAKPGLVTVILGPNGAGKTTLLRVLAGLLRPREGRVLLEGEDVYSMPPRLRAKRIAYMPPELPAPGLGQSVAEFVAASRYPYRRGLALGPSERDLEDAISLLRVLEIEELSERPLGATSSGEKQRAQIAHVLLRDAHVLVVDEPTSFQDLRGRLLIYTMLSAQAAKGRVVLIATHDMTLASLYADYIIVLDRGVKVAEGTPDEVLEARLLSKVFGVEVTMARIDGRDVPIPVRPVQKHAR